MSANRLRLALVDRAAMQWSALGVALQAPREPAVVDLEALIGLTAAVGAADARVWEGAIAWCGRYGRFANSARLKGVVAEMGIAGAERAAFATAAWRAGAPPWSLTGEPQPRAPRAESRDDLVVVKPARDAPRLLWFLRATFGVNARADIVANMAARPGSTPTVLELAELTRFTKRNAAVALDDLVLSGVVERLGPGTVGRFRLRDRPGLLRWLGMPDSVEYPDWVAQFTVGLRVSAFLDAEPSSSRVRAIEARVVVTALRTSIERADLPGPELRVTGPAFSEEFDTWVDQLAGRLEARGTRDKTATRLSQGASAPYGMTDTPSGRR